MLTGDYTNGCSGGSPATCPRVRGCVSRSRCSRSSIPGSSKTSSGASTRRDRHPCAPRRARRSRRRHRPCTRSGCRPDRRDRLRPRLHARDARDRKWRRRCRGGGGHPPASGRGRRVRAGACGARGRTRRGDRRDRPRLLPRLCASRRPAPLFVEQLELAQELGKPVIVHTRAAEQDTASLLEGFDGTVVMHCFSSPELLPVVLERGYYVSFAGNVTYPKAADLREAAVQVPAEQIARRDGLSVSCAATGPRARRTSRRTSSTPSRRSPRRAETTSMSSRTESTPMPRPRSACRERQGEEGARAALPRRREHPRRHRPAGRARREGRRSRGRAGARRSHDVSRRPRRHRPRGRARRVARAAAAGAHREPGQRGAPLRRRAAARPASDGTGSDEARREPAVQHRHAARRREPRPACPRSTSGA